MTDKDHQPQPSPQTDQPTAIEPSQTIPRDKPTAVEKSVQVPCSGGSPSLQSLTALVGK